MKKWLLVIMLFILPNLLFPLRSVREGNLLVFYNSKNTKVKAYYIRNNKVEYVYRYFYNSNKLLVRQEIWKHYQRKSFYTFDYYPKRKVKSKKYFVGRKLKYQIFYDKHGKILKKKTYNIEKKVDKKIVNEKDTEGILK